MLTQDPIGLAGGVNLYAYAGNNPISFSDPFGLTCPMPGTCTQSDGRVKGLWANTKNWLVRDNGRFGHRLTAAMGDRALDAMFAGHVVRGVAGAVGSRAAAAAAAEAEAASAAPVRTFRSADCRRTRMGQTRGGVSGTGNHDRRAVCTPCR
ncbi:MAG: hypothetical protein IPG75_17255 [Gemmatimonadetes bacterium]|nr:hypothetical protein [Gemmatimonadota bacterium]